MKSKSFETLFYSVVGVIAMAVILIAVNLLASSFKTRADLTQEKIYTLSPGTKAILAKLKSPVTIRFYCTKNATPSAESVFLENYANEVQDLLSEYKEASGGKIIIKKLDPEPDSDAEDSARLDGIQPQQLQTGDKFYLGLAVSLLDAKQTVALTPDRERLMEYDISRAISRVITPQKAVVGVMSALPLFGGPENPMMEQQGQQPPKPWAIINELSGDYTVRQVPLDTDKIDDDVKVLLVVHPQGVSDKTQFAIDQFVLRGGKLIAFLDPLSLASMKNQRSMMPQQGNSASTLDKLIPAWGLQFTSTKVVADLNDKMQMGGANGQPTEAPAVLSVTADGLNTNSVITSQISDVWLPFAGAFTGTPVDGLKETVLVKSTKDSELTSSEMAQYMGSEILKDFKSSDEEYPLAVELNGKFKTAFPDGEPAEGTNKVAKTATFLKQGNGTVILVGDSDMLADDFSMRQINTPFGSFATALNGNLSFAQNAVDQMAGDSDLIAIRSRGVEDRPFTVIKKMQATAEAAYQSKINELQTSLSATEQRLSQLQQGKSQNQRYILSPEQQQQIEDFQKKEAQTQAELKNVQKDLRRSVDSLQTRITWVNIAAVPALVTLFGVSLAAWKRKRTAAK